MVISAPTICWNKTENKSIRLAIIVFNIITDNQIKSSLSKGKGHCLRSISFTFRYTEWHISHLVFVLTRFVRLRPNPITIGLHRLCLVQVDRCQTYSKCFNSIHLLQVFCLIEDFHLQKYYKLEITKHRICVSLSCCGSIHHKYEPFDG